MSNTAEFVRKVMQEQGVPGQVRKHVVLHGWNKVTDTFATYTVDVTAKRPLKPGNHVWILKGEGPDLMPVIVIEDVGRGLWCQSLERDVKFMVANDEIHWTSIPLRPKAVPRRDLHLYLGRAVKMYEEARAANLRKLGHGQ